MWVYIIIVVSLIIAVWRIRRRWIKVKNYWADRGVPHVPPHPVWGTLTFLQKQNMVEWLRDEYQKYNDAPYFGIWLFWRPALVVRDPMISRNVLVKDFDVFRDRFLNSAASDPVGGQNIFTANDPLWSSVRKRLTSIFTAAKLRALHPLITAKTKELVQRIQKDYVEDKKTVDLREMYGDYTTDIIGAAAFGIAGDATLTGKSVMREITKVFSSYSVKRGLEFSAIFFFPELCDIFRVKFFTRKMTNHFRVLFRDIVAKRGGWDAPANSGDLLDALLKLRRESVADGEEMNEDIIIAQAAVFLQGGFDTSAVALTMVTYELAFLPDIQERLYVELCEAKNKKGVDPGALVELPYLAAVIKETLRKYPAMGYLDRVANRDYRIDDSLTVTKGTPVFTCPIGTQYDERYFPEPRVFNPDRFTPENEGAITPFTYMPFGEGPRNCIGIRFAYQTLRSALCNVVLSYKIEPVAGAPPPHKVRADPYGVFMAPDRQLAVKFIPRR